MTMAGNLGRLSNQSRESPRALQDGSRVAVIGAGPAGSLFSYFLLNMADAVSLDVDVDLFEPRHFCHRGPAGCNRCGGIVSESLVQRLATEGIMLPDAVVQRGIESYTLHTDVGDVEIETPLMEKRIAAMYAFRQNENWQTETLNFMRRELWPGHPYGNSSFGSPETVEGITREDVLAFAKKRMSPDGTVIAIAGDVDVAATLARCRQALSSLAATAGYQVPIAPAPAWAGRSFAADRFAFLGNEKKQATLCITFPSCDYLATKDRAALTVLDAFTSGIGLPSGWFHHALRGGERSYVYFVHYSLFAFLNSGCAFVYTQTEPKLLKEVYGILHGQIGRIRRGEFTDEELETGRVMALVSGPYHAQTVSDVAQEVALAELYGAGHDLPDRFQEALKKVTRADVMRVIDRYMKHMLVVVTGPEDVRKIFQEMSAGK